MNKGVFVNMVTLAIVQKFTPGKNLKREYEYVAKLALWASWKSGAPH